MKKEIKEGIHTLKLLKDDPEFQEKSKKYGKQLLHDIGELILGLFVLLMMFSFAMHLIS
jgi:hypothetical protein|uniref:Uncharacterized protein n=1 Tax=Podoviridae sp. ctiuS14 TaxID=2827620 RepID=A0A8S5LM13_9CAUD|nr:MAG TPA: hypothetical protein [Podoviridae sp. ctiuS14]